MVLGCLKAQIEEDLSFLRDSIITTEVNIARIFNYDVRRRRQEKDDKLVAELEAKWEYSVLKSETIVSSLTAIVANSKARIVVFEDGVVFFWKQFGAYDVFGLVHNCNAA